MRIEEIQISDLTKRATKPCFFAPRTDRIPVHETSYVKSHECNVTVLPEKSG